MRYDAYDIRLMEQAESEGMYSGPDRAAITGFQAALAECWNEGRAFSVVSGRVTFQEHGFNAPDVVA